MIKKGDVLILIVCSVILLAFFIPKDAGKTVNIYSNGELIKSVPLSENCEFEFHSKYGSNTVVVENKKAYIKDATCPDKLCKHQGGINQSGAVITCLPNRFSVEISGKEYDAVSR